MLSDLSMPWLFTGALIMPIWSLVGLIFASCVQNIWIWIRIWYYPVQSWTFWGVCMPGRWKRSRSIRWIILQYDQDKGCKFPQRHTLLYVSAVSVHHLHANVWMCLSVMECLSYPKKMWKQVQDIFWIDFFCAGIYHFSRLYTGWSVFAKLTEGQCEDNIEHWDLDWCNFASVWAWTQVASSRCSRNVKTWCLCHVSA